MIKTLVALVVAGAVGLAVSGATVTQLFDLDVWGFLERLDDRGPAFAVVIAIPILLMIVRGLFGMVLTMAFVAGAAALALKFRFEQDLPWEQALTMTAIYALVAVGVYRVLVGRA